VYHFFQQLSIGTLISNHHPDQTIACQSTIKPNGAFCSISITSSGLQAWLSIRRFITFHGIINVCQINYHIYSCILYIFWDNFNVTSNHIIVAAVSCFLYKISINHKTLLLMLRIGKLNWEQTTAYHIFLYIHIFNSFYIGKSINSPITH
jgi:hypothetical protein